MVFGLTGSQSKETPMGDFGLIYNRLLEGEAARRTKSNRASPFLLLYLISPAAFLAWIFAFFPFSSGFEQIKNVFTDARSH